MTVANQTTFVDVYGKKTQLLRGGSGPPLVYLHSAAGETDWFPLLDKLGEHFTVYAPAHPGFALSEGLEEIDDIVDMAWHYVDLLAKLDLKGVPVVGFSLGAWIAAELAVLRPALASKLVLIAAAGLRVEGAPIAELFVDDMQKIRNLVFFDPNGPLAKAALPASAEDPRILMWLRAREATARVGWNPYLHDPRLAAHLRRIECPALVLWGRHDRLIPLAHGEAYAKLLPQARLEVLEDAGHMVPLEKPAEIARLITDFVRG